MAINKYEAMRRDIVDMLANGKMHSTMVGKIVNFGEGPAKDLKTANEFADYIVDLAYKAEQLRKDNVKKKAK